MVYPAMVRTPNAWRAHPYWPAWPCLVQSQIHGAQVIQYHLHSSQALWPVGSQSDHKARRPTSVLPQLTRMPKAPGSWFGSRGCVHHLRGHRPVARGWWHWFSAPLCLSLCVCVCALDWKYKSLEMKSGRTWDYASQWHLGQSWQETFSISVL